MEINDKRSLSVLMTALYIAKWESDDDNSHVNELSGSPFFSKLYHDVIDEAIRLDLDKPAAIRRWEDWRSIEQRPDQLARTRARIRNIRQWPSWPLEQKRQVVEYLLSPFKATEVTLQELILISF